MARSFAVVAMGVAMWGETELSLLLSSTWQQGVTLEPLLSIFFARKRIDLSKEFHPARREFFHGAVNSLSPILEASAWKEKSGRAIT